MKRFIGHIDHITWASQPATFEKNVATLEAVCGIVLDRFDNEALGFRMCLGWEAGIEVMAPMPGRTEFNGPLHDFLDQRGEGVYAVVFGARSLEAHTERLRALGYDVGPRMGAEDRGPWEGKVAVRERIRPNVMNSWIVLVQFDCRDDVIRYDDVAE